MDPMSGGYFIQSDDPFIRHSTTKRFLWPKKNRLNFLLGLVIKDLAEKLEKDFYNYFII
jgi:hypothetical protein